MALEPEDLSFEEYDDDWGPDAGPSTGSMSIVIHGRTVAPYVLRSVARLVLGGATEGGEIFLDRLKTWDTKAESLGRALYHEAPDETQSERLRYAVLGLAAVGAGLARNALSRTASASEAAYGLVSGLLGPFTSSRLMRPVTRRYDGLAARGGATLERLIDVGRATEQRSRALVRQAYIDGSTEVIQVAVGKMADEPAVRDLVTQQGTSMAGEMLDVLRNAAARADARSERLVHTLLRRP